MDWRWRNSGAGESMRKKSEKEVFLLWRDDMHGQPCITAQPMK